MERRQISEERGRREEEERRSEDALPAVNTRSVGEEREEDKGRVREANRPAPERRGSAQLQLSSREIERKRTQKRQPDEII
ncbi:hypothetical protein Tco_0455794 [Tanacetum coccineum]